MGRISVRDLLILALTVGIAAGWWLDRQYFDRRLKEAEKWRTIAGGLEHFWDMPNHNVRIRDGRLFVELNGKFTWKLGDVGVHEFEPVLKACQRDDLPLKPYYSDWPRKNPSQGFEVRR